MARLQRKSKVISLPAAAALVPDGCTLTLAGYHSHNTAMALLRQLIRRGVRDLTILPTPSTGLWVDMLIAAGAVKTVYCSYIGLEFLGLANNFRRAAEAGRITVYEMDEASIVNGFRAAAGAAPFHVMPPIHLLSDLPKVNPLFKVIRDPYTGKDVVAAPALMPDLAIIHVHSSDPHGNARLRGGLHLERIIAFAAKKVILQTEEIIDPEVIMAEPNRTDIPGFLVEAVVRAPFGAHPTSSSHSYTYDEEHLRHYANLAHKDRTQEYLDEFVFGTKDEQGYLERIGLSRLLSLRLG